MLRECNLKYKPRPYDTVISNYTIGERVTIEGYAEWNLTLDQIKKYGKINWDFSRDYIEIVKLCCDTIVFNKKSYVVEPKKERLCLVPQEDIEEYVKSKVPIVDDLIVEKPHWWNCC